MAESRHIALLRGVNIGSTRRVAMPELRDLLTGLGYGDVRTLVNSGNVVLTSRKEPARVERELEQAIAKELGVDTRVLVRTRDELADVIEHNPMPDATSDGKALHVSFLEEKPKAAVVRELEAADVSPEAIAVRGREVYLFMPRGMQRSQAVKVVADDRIGVVSTRRNWNTVTKLLALADE